MTSNCCSSQEQGLDNLHIQVTRGISNKVALHLGTFKVHIVIEPVKGEMEREQAPATKQWWTKSSWRFWKQKEAKRRQREREEGGDDEEQRRRQPVHRALLAAAEVREDDAGDHQQSEAETRPTSEKEKQHQQKQDCEQAKHCKNAKPSEHFRSTEMKKEKAAIEKARQQENSLDIVYDIIASLTQTDADIDGWVDLTRVGKMAERKTLTTEQIHEAINNWEGLNEISYSPEKTMVKFLDLDTTYFAERDHKQEAEEREERRQQNEQPHGRQRHTFQ